MLMCRTSLVLIASLMTSLTSHSQVALQPWVQVYGTVGGYKLGYELWGVKPNLNLPYKAAIWSGGYISFYRLQSPTDTAARFTFPGYRMRMGDLNGDSLQDVVVYNGVNGYDTVFIFWGATTNIDLSNPLKIPAENHNDALRPACIGDINNDGLEDLILSAQGYPNQYARGKIYIYLGPVNNSAPDFTIEGDTTDAGLGVSCAIADLNNDGFNDLVVRGMNQLGPQSTRYNYVNIYWGRSDTLDFRVGMQLKGRSVNFQGMACFDANGDGIPDLLWTNRDSVGDWVYVHYGGANFDSLPNLLLRNPGVANFGYVITNAGDMNGDGYDDIAVGVPDGTITSGFVFVFSGGPRVDGNFDAAVGMSLDSRFGISVATLGDVNGDGLADILIGAPNYDFGAQKGYWGIFKGDSAIQITDVRESGVLPKTVKLYQNYPNPFNPTATIEYQLSKRAFVSLNVYDVLGREVRTLVNQQQEAGNHSMKFDGSGLSSGIYFYQIVVTEQDGEVIRETKKMVLLF